MSNVRVLPVGSKHHPDAILEEARGTKLARVVVLGWTEDGTFYRAGSENIETTVYLLRNAEHELFKEMDELERVPA